MGEVARLFPVLLSLFADNVLARSLLLAAMVVVVLCLGFPVLRHPRYLARLVVVTLLATTAALLCQVGWLSKEHLLQLLLVLFAIGSYGCLSLLAVKRPLLWSKGKIDGLNYLISQGWAWNDDKMFAKKPFYLWDFAEHFHYQRAKARYLQHRGKHLAAWEVYRSIPQGKLLPDEKETLMLDMATLACVHLGDIKTARKLLGEVKDKSLPRYLILDAYVCEMMGDMDEALARLQEALANCPDSAAPALRATIYNQLGRMRRVGCNYLDTAYYYRKAAAEAAKGTEKDVLHAAYHNLVMTNLLMGEREEAKAHLAAYMSRLNMEIVSDWMELMNLKVDMARQMDDRAGIIQYLVQGYRHLVGRIDTAAKLQLDVNVLRAMRNAGVLSERILADIAANLQDYFALDMPARYFALKEILYCLSSVDEKHIVRYREVHAQITGYMMEHAGAEIKDYVERLPDYAIYERCAMEIERAAVVKKYERPYKFERVYAIINDVKDIYQINGHFIASAKCNLDIADEALFARRLDVVQEHVIQAERNLAKIKGHPIVSEFYLRLAYYYLFLQNLKEARFFFECFQQTGVSINHCDTWLQGYFNVLRQALGAEPA